MTTSIPSASALHGGTALGAHAEHASHRLGNALRALRVFAVAAVEVVLLGAHDAEALRGPYPAETGGSA